jgi:mRNA degradation ribonuclease J1/J2
MMPTKPNRGLAVSTAPTRASAQTFEVRIHRGAHEIGGNCVELRRGKDTLILDIGKPLSAAWDTVIPLPAAIGLDDNGTRPLGVVISHGHQDHWGLAPQLPTDIPVFIGEGAANILRAAQFWGVASTCTRLGTCATGCLSPSGRSPSPRTWPTTRHSTRSPC